MSDQFEHNLGDHEDPLPGPTWIIGILGSVLLAVVVLGVTALFFNADARMIDTKVMEQAYPQFETLKEAQLARLQGPPRKVEVVENDKVVETVVIPIEQAMQKLVAKASAEQAGASHGSAGQ
jgi:hypothetical protein